MTQSEGSEKLREEEQFVLGSEGGVLENEHPVQPQNREAGEQSGKAGKTSGCRGKSWSVVWNKAEAGEITKDWTFTVPASCITN